MSVEISDWNDLDNVRNDLSGDYVLVNDLDSETDGYAGIGDDWNPIGEQELDGDFYEGIFDGDGFEIRDLIVDTTERNVGLFSGLRSPGEIRNLSVVGDITTTSDSLNAAVLCSENRGLIENCDTAGSVTASSLSALGGLVGRNEGPISESYATGSVEGDENVGGLVGFNPSTISGSYATGSVEGDENVGGLIGRNGDIISDSYATGTVEGGSGVGGLVGQESSGDDEGIIRCYSYNTVTGNSDVGGFCGKLGVGGFFPANGNISDSYVDIVESGQDDAIGTIINEGEADINELSTSEMQGSAAETNMSEFDFAAIWDSVLESDGDASADGYPILSSLDRQRQLEAQGIFQDLQPPEPPANLTAELL